MHPVCFTYLVYTVHPTASRASPINVQSTLTISKHSIQVGRINLEPSQATASKHWSLLSVWVRVRVGWYQLTPRYNKLGVRIRYPHMGVRKLTRRLLFSSQYSLFMEDYNYSYRQFPYSTMVATYCSSHNLSLNIRTHAISE